MYLVVLKTIFNFVLGHPLPRGVPGGPDCHLPPQLGGWGQFRPGSGGSDIFLIYILASSTTGLLINSSGRCCESIRHPGNVRGRHCYRRRDGERGGSTGNCSNGFFAGHRCRTTCLAAYLYLGDRPVGRPQAPPKLPG